MVASFLVSVAKETGIVLMLLPRAKIGVRRYQLLGYLSSCCSALLFFFGALLEDFMGSDSGRVIIGGLNVGSGVLLWASTLYTLKAEHY